MIEELTKEETMLIFNDLVDFSGKVDKSLNPCILNIGQVKQK